jgi:hypothetical protein
MEMQNHPFLNPDTLPKFIPLDALTTIPNIKSNSSSIKEDIDPQHPS